MKWSLMAGCQTWRFDCIDHFQWRPMKKKFKFRFVKSGEKKEEYVKVLPESFYLNSNTIGFCQEIYQL